MKDPTKPVEIAMKPVKSSAITHYGYDPSSRTFALNWKAGKSYRYADVPPHLVEDLAKAKSVGAFVTQRIVGKFELIR